jgi:hypothetical protein
MMTLLTHLPDHVVGFSASGQVDAQDYETVLMPAIDAVLQRHQQVRLLYQLTAQFTGFTAGAMWDDAKLGLANWNAWERIAVVTDLDWVAHATRMFAFMMPGRVKIFSNAQRADAEKWVAA